MGKPRLIILIRHAQSEGNKDKNIHQHTPDHKVKLTDEGHLQSREAGRKLRALLRSDDTLHFFISPYRRTRDTTEGILSTLCSDEPDPSPFKRSKIKVYEEPRLREQDFGNFQPSRDEVERLWKERAEYGHFFYRIPNGESGADCADRCSSFNESLWRRFSDSDMASVAIIVSHGMVIRCFLMRWYHFSVEYFEDLRNINHVEFIVMRLNPDNGKYILQNQLRTWSEMKRERAARGSISGFSVPDIEIPTQRRWGECPDGCTNPDHGHAPTMFKRKPVRQNTADLFKDDNELLSMMNARSTLSSSPLTLKENQITEEAISSSPPTPSIDQMRPQSEGPSNLTSFPPIPAMAIKNPALNSLGRDGGGSTSGGASPYGTTEEDEPYTDVPPAYDGANDTPKMSSSPFKPSSLARALRGELGGSRQAMADALGDQSDAEIEEADAEMGDKQRQKEEEHRILEHEKRDRSMTVTS